MQDKLKVAVFGTGQMGSGIIKLLMRKQGVELVGVYGRRADRAGVDVGEAIGLDKKLGVALTADLPGMLSSAKPNVVIQATCSKVEQAADEIKTAVRGGANVISIAEEMSYPSYEAPGLSEEIHQLAIENGGNGSRNGHQPRFCPGSAGDFLDGRLLQRRIDHRQTSERPVSLRPVGSANPGRGYHA